MLTAFGKEVRKLRIEHNVKLKDFAGEVGVSSSYLSAVESGKKSVPPTLPSRIAEYFGLDAAATRRLEELAAKSSKEVRINLGGMSDKRKEVAAAFARRFPQMNDIDMDALMRVLSNSRDRER